MQKFNVIQLDENKVFTLQNSNKKIPTSYDILQQCKVVNVKRSIAKYKVYRYNNLQKPDRVACKQMQDGCPQLVIYSRFDRTCYIYSDISTIYIVCQRYFCYRYLLQVDFVKWDSRSCLLYLPSTRARRQFSVRYFQDIYFAIRTTILCSIFYLIEPRSLIHLLHNLTPITFL